MSIEQLRAFANAALDAESLDGFELQELALRHGLLAPTEVDEPCGETCACSEYGDFPQLCYRRTPLLTGRP